MATLSCSVGGVGSGSLAKGKWVGKRWSGIMTRKTSAPSECVWILTVSLCRSRVSLSVSDAAAYTQTRS